ncbi:hypothetical protein LIER_09958 [Lithospermum erythrorhizon]|uniref:Reverse transcriptase Ty1/copia-type domain-containing protein n=1 Tax=Lithospermum erythrorhizon TaxID=34254 RepID=A0AAV3PHQ0_LITER
MLALNDLGNFSYFLGVEVQRNGSGLFLSQSKYIKELLIKHGMKNCSTVRTPSMAKSSAATPNNPCPNPHAYRCLVGALQYLAFTWPDITFAVNQASQVMHNPSLSDMTDAKRILRYLTGIVSLGICLKPSTSLFLEVYSDWDWAGCQVTRRSTIGFFVFYLVVILYPGPPRNSLHFPNQAQRLNIEH